MHTLRVAYGEAAFFEQEFRNPLHREAVFTIVCSDPDLTLVRSGAEWRCLRRVSGMAPAPKAVEDDALSGNRLFLMPQELVRVPFKFQSFTLAPGSAAAASGPDEEEEEAMAAGSAGASSGWRIAPRTVTITFIAEGESDVVSRGLPQTVAEVHVRPRSLMVSRTVRFHAGEYEFMKQHISLKAAVGGGFGLSAQSAARALPLDEEAEGLTVRCSDGAVACGLAPSKLEAHELSSNDEVYVKYKCGAAPERRHFLLLTYRDRFMAGLTEAWEVIVHARRRVDMAAIVGQTSHGSVVVRGGPTSRRVRCFCSHPDELQIAPDSFLLPAGALTELMLSFRPLVPGHLEVHIHIVDTEARELVHALLVSTEARAPTISKTFEVELHPHELTHKKISYTNPYPAPKMFHLRSTHPNVVRFRPERLQLPAGATRPVGLTFAAGEDWGSLARKDPIDVLVFVNDQEDTNEETFRVRVACV